jgi:hypothetical protein
MEKEKEEQPPPISFSRIQEEVIRTRRIYHKEDFSEEPSDSIISRLLKEARKRLKQEEEKKIKERFEKRPDEHKLIYTKESLMNDIIQTLKNEKKCEKSSIEKHKKYVNSKGNLKSSKKKVLDELGVQIRNMGKWDKSAKKEIEGNPSFHKDYEACLDAVLKAAKSGFNDHPFVEGWIESLRVLGRRDILTKTRTSRSRILEKGIKRPMSPDEIKLYIRVDDLHEESSDYSRYKIYEKVKEEGLYKGSYVSFNKWLSRNDIEIEQKRGRLKRPVS